MGDLLGVHREAISWEMLCHDEHTTVSETPIYDPQSDSLYWMSLYEPALKRMSLEDGSRDSWELPSPYVGSYALYDDGSGAIVAATTGIHALDFATGVTTLLHAAPYDQERSRFNDGRCDPAGRFWVGTFSPQLNTVPHGQESYYRVDETGIHAAIGGMTIANGTAFSPDGTVLYVADRVNGRILSYDFDVGTGEVTNPRTFVNIKAGEIPDGAAVDSRGGYWVAMYGQGEIRRYTRDGRLDRVLAAPLSRPTMCAFGGASLGRLFLTTSRLRATREELEQEPLSGAVFVADVGESGIPEPRFPRRWAPPRATS